MYFLDSVMRFESGELVEMGLEEIAAGDILHVYEDSGIVRTDGQFTGGYERVRESDDIYYAEIDDELFQIRAINNKRPVYSFDGILFSTLYDINSATLLEELEGEDVAFALDVNDSLQMISGELLYNEKTVLIEDSGTRDIYVIEKDGGKNSYRTDNYSVLMEGPTDEGNMVDFYRGSIAYLTNDGNIIDKIVRIAEPYDISEDAVDVARDARGRFDIDLSDMDIRLVDKTYDYTVNTNIFVVNMSDDTVTRIAAMTMEDILDMVDEDSDLRAYVISNRDFTMMELGNKLDVGNSDDIAHTIVFTDFELDDKLVETEILLLEFSFNPSGDREVTGDDSTGQSVDLDVADFAVIPAMDSGDLVEFVLENGEVIAANVLLDSESDEYEVTAISTRNERISLDGEEYWLAPDYMVFGDTSVSSGDTVSVVFNPEVAIEVEIILVR